MSITDTANVNRDDLCGSFVIVSSQNDTDDWAARHHGKTNHSLRL
jgi:hypothetical protein